jgi:hypothetical protein
MPSTEDGECFEPGGTTRTSKGGKDDGREGKGTVRTIMLSVCFLVETSNGAADGVPECEEESDGRKGLFASRELVGLFVALGRAALGGLGGIGVDLVNRDKDRIEQSKDTRGRIN